jgi:hypothetical protein
MYRWMAGMAVLAGWPLWGATAADLARAMRETSFDRQECYRVRDLTLIREDIRIYLNDGHLIFSKPVAGRRIAAVYTTDVENGDGEAILLPPDRAERRSLAQFTGSPNLDEHFRSAVFLFTGGEYDAIISQFPNNPANRKAPEIGAVLDEEWTPVLRNLLESYQTRLVLELLDGPARRPGLLVAMLGSPKFGNFDLLYDPDAAEQITVGQVASRNNTLSFNYWANFPSRSARGRKVSSPPDFQLSDYRIEATVNPDLSLDAVTRVKVTPTVDGAPAVWFDLAEAMTMSRATVDGRPAEVLQREAAGVDAMRDGNAFILVVPPEPLHTGRTYEFEIHHSGKIIRDAGDRVYYVGSRGNWYPSHGLQWANYDLRFRVAADLDVVTPGDVVDDRTEGEWRTVRRRTSAPIRLAGFNLGNYGHATVERAGYVVDVYANRTLETALRPKPQMIAPPRVEGRGTRRDRNGLQPLEQVSPPAPDPLDRLQAVAAEVAGSLEFMVSKFGPPALPHLTVSPIPGAFAQGFPGLIYLSTLAYLKNPPESGGNVATDLFFGDIMQAHEMAHQWWGNRVTASSYRDYWLMEALANYSALLYLEKTKGTSSVELMLDSYRQSLLRKAETAPNVDAVGPIALGPRLESSLEPNAWRDITYGKGSWIIQMLRRRMGDERFFAMLAELLKRFDHRELTTEQFRETAALFLPPKSGDPQLESFFDQWVDGTGIPTLKLTYVLKGKAPALRLVGTLTQSDVEDEEFSALVPVEIQIARGRTITQWVPSGNTPATFTVALAQPPLKVTLDPHYAVLRR